MADSSGASEEVASTGKRLQESEASRQALEEELAEAKRSVAALKDNAARSEALIGELQQVLTPQA